MPNTLLLGFYQDKACLEASMREAGDLGEYEDTDFSFMDELRIVDDEQDECLIPNMLFPPVQNVLTMGDFLHGFCHIFSLRLHNEYGYKVENLYDEDGGLIHSYCRTPDGGYVDIRGITADAQVFFDEFADFLDPMNPYLCSCNNTPTVLDGDGDKQLYDATEYILRDYSSCYTA